MVRPRSSLPAWFAVVVPLLLLAAAACSSSPEYQLLDQFFRASRMRDNATLGNIATVAMNPTEDGTVQSFEVIKVEPEQRRPLKLRELAKAEEEARATDEAFNKQKKEYQDANREAIDRVLKAERTNQKLKGKDLEVQAAWTKWRDQTEEHAKQVSEARRALSTERSQAEVSIFDARNPIDATKYDGDLLSKEVLIRAKVKKGDAAPVEKQLHLKLMKTELRNGPDGKTATGRWVITHVSEANS